MMTISKLSGMCFALLLSFQLGAHSPAPAPAKDKLKEVIQGKQRSAAHKARDEYRHPYETLTFFGIKETMTVVELTPGSGWYTEILAPYLKDKGQYVAAGYDPKSESDYYRKNAEKFQKKMSSDPASYSKTRLTVMQLPDKFDFIEAGTADMVLTFRNTHHWASNNAADKVFNAIFKALKPGGVFGLVQHRAGYEKPEDKSGKMGYLSQKEVIKMAEKAGFKLVEKSNINANLKDTKDYAKGVWTLPPVYRMKEENKAVYKAIGESDRMTLKFVKQAVK